MHTHAPDWYISHQLTLERSGIILIIALLPMCCNCVRWRKQRFGNTNDRGQHAQRAELSPSFAIFRRLDFSLMTSADFTVQSSAAAVILLSPQSVIRVTLSIRVKLRVQTC